VEVFFGLLDVWNVRRSSQKDKIEVPGPVHRLPLNIRFHHPQLIHFDCNPVRRS